MSWQPLGTSDVVPEGKASVAEIGDLRVALCRTASGLYAIEDRCTHDGESLDQGELIGDEIECPRHGARFDVRTGRVLRLPAVRPVKSFPVREIDGRIEVDLP